MVRDRQTRDTDFWAHMMIYMWEYVDGNGLLNDSHFEPHVRKFWRDMKADKKSMLELLDTLEADCIQRKTFLTLTE